MVKVGAVWTSTTSTNLPVRRTTVADMAGPVQILVVDDEEPIRNALKKFLTQQQYEVYAAGTGDDAYSSTKCTPRAPVTTRCSSSGATASRSCCATSGCPAPAASTS